jgi:hypothetical protein
MKLHSIFILIVSASIIVSCKKKPVTYSTSAIWTVRDIEYSSNTIIKSGNCFKAARDLNSMTAYFKTAPTATANYRIADENKVSNNTLGDNEIAIDFNVGGTDDYITTGIAVDSATVTISGGIMTIKVLSTQVRHYAGGYALDNTTGSGVLKTDKY